MCLSNSEEFIKPAPVIPVTRCLIPGCKRKAQQEIGMCLQCERGDNAVKTIAAVAILAAVLGLVGCRRPVAHVTCLSSGVVVYDGMVDSAKASFNGKIFISTLDGRLLTCSEVVIKRGL